MGEIRISIDKYTVKIMSYKNQIINLKINRVINQEYNENVYRIDIEITKKCLFNRVKTIYITLYESTILTDVEDLFTMIVNNRFGKKIN